MKLVHPDIETAFVFEDKINVLNIENGAFFRELVEDLYSQINGFCGNFVLSDNETVLDLSKNAVILADFFNLDFSDKKMQNKLYSKLQTIVADKLQAESSNLNLLFYEFFNKLNSESDFSLDYCEETAITNIFKCFGLTFSVQELSFIEKLTRYIEILTQLLGFKLVVLINLKSFLSETELDLIYQFFTYNDIKVLLLENGAKQKNSSEFAVTIDNDLCEILA